MGGGVGGVLEVVVAVAGAAAAGRREVLAVKMVRATEVTVVEVVAVSVGAAAAGGRETVRRARHWARRKALANVKNVRGP